MNKSVHIITGAGSGIGAAIAKNLATPNTLLIIHTRKNKEGLTLVADNCRAQGAEVYCLFGDLSNPETIEQLITTLLAQSDHLDSLICNAGFPDWRAHGELDQAGLTQSYDVIVNSTFALLDKCTPLLTKCGGSVVAISSFLAHKFKVGNAIVPASSTAKAALEALIKSYAAQYAPVGITANVVVPGYIKKNSPDHQPLDQASLQRITDCIPAARLGQPKDVADLVEFLISSKANYITGQLIHIDGGLLLS